MNNEIAYMRELIIKGTDNWTEWIKDNPEKISEILKSLYDEILDKIIEGS
jgi:hypothetical protein